MDEAYEILEYLPSSCKTQNDQEYITFLWETFESNYKNEKYQFAFLAYHMLFMTFVYFCIWQIKINKREDFEKALVGFHNDIERDLISASSPFVFHKVNESAIFRFLKLVGCDKGKIGNYVRIVRERNNIAHSSGNIFYNSQETIDEKISIIISLVKEIQEQIKPIILECFEQFLLTSYDPEEREYLDSREQIQEELIHKNYMSEKDILVCREYDISTLEENPNYDLIEELFELIDEFTVYEEPG